MFKREASETPYADPSYFDFRGVKIWLQILTPCQKLTPFSL